MNRLVLKSGDTVTGADVEIVSPTGMVTRTIRSKILIDATEWGDVVPLTGARYRVGNCLNDAIVPTQHVQDNTWTAVVKQYAGPVPPELLLTEKPPGYSEALHQRFAKSLVMGVAGAQCDGKNVAIILRNLVKSGATQRGTKP